MMSVSLESEAELSVQMREDVGGPTQDAEMISVERSKMTGDL